MERCPRARRRMAPGEPSPFGPRREAIWLCCNHLQGGAEKKIAGLRRPTSASVGHVWPRRPRAATGSPPDRDQKPSRCEEVSPVRPLGRCEPSLQCSGSSATSSRAAREALTVISVSSKAVLELLPARSGHHGPASRCRFCVFRRGKVESRLTPFQHPPR